MRTGRPGQRMPGRRPRWSRMRSPPRPGADPVGLLLGQAERGCRSWCRSGTGGCRCCRSLLPGRGAADGAELVTTPASGCGCSCAGTPTCPISGRSPRRSATWFSMSTTSMRPCGARSSGMSSGWRRARRWPAGKRVHRQGPPQHRPGGGRSVPDRCAASPGSHLDVWYAHLDIEQAIGQFRSPRSETGPGSAIQNGRTRRPHHGSSHRRYGR